MSEYTDQDWALYPRGGSGRGFKTETGEHEGRAHRTTEGLVETPHGLVSAYSSFFQGSYKVSRVEMIKDGRVHFRRWGNKEFTARGLVTKAKQFAAELYA